MGKLKRVYLDNNAIDLFHDDVDLQARLRVLIKLKRCDLVVSLVNIQELVGFVANHGRGGFESRIRMLRGFCTRGSLLPETGEYLDRAVENARCRGQVRSQTLFGKGLHDAPTWESVLEGLPGNDSNFGAFARKCVVDGRGGNQRIKKMRGALAEKAKSGKLEMEDGTPFQKWRDGIPFERISNLYQGIARSEGAAVVRRLASQRDPSTEIVVSWF